jgi:arsenate reductase-like glutaredoxin family protein
VDRDSKRFADLGLTHAQYSEERWLHKLAEDPFLLRIPLSRYGAHLAIGVAEEEWRGWLQR